MTKLILEVLGGPAPAVDTPPPRLGQDYDAVYRELGADQAGLEALRSEGVI